MIRLRRHLIAPVLAGMIASACGGGVTTIGENGETGPTTVAASQTTLAADTTIPGIIEDGPAGTDAGATTGPTSSLPAPLSSTPSATAPLETGPGDTAPRETTPANNDPVTTTSASPTTTTDDSQSTPLDPEWAAHPAAFYIPEPSFFGPDFVYDYGRVTEAAPSDPDDVIEGCDAPPPPTLSGIEADFSDGNVEIEVMVGIDDAEGAQASIESFRALGTCDPSTLNSATIEILNIASNGDDGTVLLIEGDRDTIGPLTAIVAFTRHDDHFVGVFVGWEGEETPIDGLDAAMVMAWADELAARG